MTTAPSPPDFGPVPRPTPRGSGAWDRRTADKIDYLRSTDCFTKQPTSWGFTLYRAVFGPGTDERFAEALMRLRAWIQWDAKQSRYSSDLTDEGILSKDPTIPAPDAPHDTDELAKRFWIEVVEDYPDREAVRCGSEVEEGSEDFSAVGCAFIAWVRENGKDVDQLEAGNFATAGHPDLYVRNDHCLIVDKRALAALETLPENPPAVGPMVFEEWVRCHDTYQHAWLWLLDRKTMRAQELGMPPVRPSWMELDHPPFPPWCRVHTMHLFDLWFGRPEGHISGSWASVVAESKKDEEWGKVQYWDEAATTTNEVLAHHRKVPPEMWFVEDEQADDEDLYLVNGLEEVRSKVQSSEASV